MSNYSLQLKLQKNGKYRLFLRGADLSGAWLQDVSGELDLEAAMMVEDGSRGSILIDRLAGDTDAMMEARK